MHPKTISYIKAAKNSSNTNADWNKAPLKRLVGRGTSSLSAGKTVEKVFV